MKMKTINKIAAALVLISSQIIPHAFAETTKEHKTVYITSIVEHPALDKIKLGVEDTLKENGYIEGENLTLRYQSAQGSSANAAQIAKLFVSDKPDVIVGTGTPSAQALAAATRTIPVIFAAVTDPVAAKLTPSWEASKTNITGASDALELGPQIELMKKVIPDLKSVGFIYSPSEINSTIILKQLTEILAKDNIKIVAVPAQRTSDIPTAAMSLKGKVDLIYTTTDNNVVSAFESLVKVANESKIPLVASDPDSAKRGAVVALGVSYYDLGKQAGNMVIRILNGEYVGDIAPETSKKFDLVINKDAAKKQGVTLSDDLIESASEIIE